MFIGIMVSNVWKKRNHLKQHESFLFLLLFSFFEIYISGAKYEENCFNISREARWKTRGRGPGVRGTGSRGVENTGCGTHRVWKTRGVENTGCGKHRVWKTRGLVGNTGSGGNNGVWWKTRGLSGKHGV